MMTIVAEEIGAATNAIAGMGVTKKPYFHYKASAIAQSGEYSPSNRLSMVGVVFNLMVMVFSLSARPTRWGYAMRLPK